MKDEDRVLMLRTLAVIVLAIITVAVMTTGFVFIVEEPGARWDLAMNHIMFGVVVGSGMTAALIAFHFVTAYLRYRSQKRHR